MAISASYNRQNTPNNLITKALRICQVIGEGESPSTNALTDHLETLNDLIQVWHADGMELFVIDQDSFNLVSTVSTYQIGVGQSGNNVNNVAPLRVLQAWTRDTSVTPNTDVEMTIITREQYNRLSPKASTGTPVQLYYEPPIGQNWATEIYGKIYVWPTPDATAATNKDVYISYVRPFEDLDTGTQNLEFTRTWYKPLCWGLAADLAYEYGLPFSERAMIEKKAQYYKALALQTEAAEGSMFIQPDFQMRMNSY